VFAAGVRDTPTRVISRAGFGLKFVKMFQACIHKFFIPFEATIFLFLEVHLLCSLWWLLWVKWLWFFFS